jgi:hypothetical protein
LLPIIETGHKPYVVLEELVVMVKDVHSSALLDKVVFPLRYLYRLASINPE